MVISCSKRREASFGQKEGLRMLYCMRTKEPIAFSKTESHIGKVYKSGREKVTLVD